MNNKMVSNLQKLLIASAAVISLAFIAAVTLPLLTQKNDTQQLHVLVIDALTKTKLSTGTVQLDVDGKLYATATVKDGYARFDNVPKGTITVRATSEGFKQFVQTFTPQPKEASRLVLAPLEKQTTTQPTIPSGPALKASFLIVSNKQNLEAKYGIDIAQQVEIEMTELARIVQQNDNIASIAVMLDDDAEMKKLAATTVTSSQSNDPDAALRSIRSVLASTGAKYLLIVGGDKIVPFQKIRNPMSDFPGPIGAFLVQEDPLVLTDHPYSFLQCDNEADKCNPAIAVGRLPDGNEEKSTSTTLADLLLASQKLHSQNIQKPSEVATTVSADSIAPYYSNNNFELAGPQKIAPPTKIANLAGFNEPGSIENVRQFISNHEIVYLSVHGNLPLEPQALEGRMPDGEGRALVINTQIAKDFEYKTALFVSDACHGSNPNRKEEDALWMQFLRKGAVGFVGSTMTALSDARVAQKTFDTETDIQNLGLSNTVAYFMIKNYRKGETTGDALMHAKTLLKNNNPADRLTNLEFILYGDPTLHAT
ncbi:MAG TPA: C25 family cysteine peptidase [Candidatus Norongarragalinales archaeon]|jgi:hypothetical protein|nr:C25 family cysteine peptidase [Candidatus Norongarragalinales archaeon]